MKKYGIIWIALFLSVIFLLAEERFYYSLANFYHHSENLLVLGIALIFSTQITGFLYLARKIKDLEKKAPPRDRDTSQEST